MGREIRYTPRKSTSYLLSQPPGVGYAKCKNVFCYEFKTMWKAAAMAYFRALPHDYVTVQAISYQLFSTKPEMQSHAHPHEICKAQSNNGTGSTPGTPVSSCQLPYLPKGKTTLI